MVCRICVAVSLISFLLVSCKTSPQQNNGPVFKLVNPTFTSPDGNDVVMNGPAPDGQKAKIIIPSGHGFVSAKLLVSDNDEPLTVNVNKWLNNLTKTNGVEYVDSSLRVAPVLTSLGEFDMTHDDIIMVNELLETRGFDLKISSSENGLTYSRYKP